MRTAPPSMSPIFTIRIYFLQLHAVLRICSRILLHSHPRLYTLRAHALSRTHCGASSVLSSKQKQWCPIPSSSSRTLSACTTLTRVRAPGLSRRRRVRDAPMKLADLHHRGCAHFCCGLGRREQLQRAVAEDDTASAGPSRLGTRGPRRRSGPSCGRPDEQWQALAAPCVRVRPHLAAATLRQITRRATGGVRKTLLQHWKRGPLSRAAMER